MGSICSTTNAGAIFKPIESRPVVQGGLCIDLVLQYHSGNSCFARTDIPSAQRTSDPMNPRVLSGIFQGSKCSTWRGVRPQDSNLLTGDIQCRSAVLQTLHETQVSISTETAIIFPKFGTRIFEPQELISDHSSSGAVR
jgi:hypothetical protein